MAHLPGLRVAKPTISSSMGTLLGRGGQDESRIIQQVRDRALPGPRRPHGRLCLHLYPSKAFSRVSPPGPPYLGQPFSSQGHSQSKLGFSLKPLPPEAATRGPLAQRSEGQGDHLTQAQTVSPLRLKAPGTPALAARNASFVADLRSSSFLSGTLRPREISELVNRVLG